MATADWSTSGVEQPRVQSDTNEPVLLVTWTQFLVTSSSVPAPSQSPTFGQPLLWLPEPPRPLHWVSGGPAHASHARAHRRSPGNGPGQGVWTGQARRPPRRTGLPARKTPNAFYTRTPSPQAQSLYLLAGALALF